MKIGKRLFPYPVLNAKRGYSQFKDSIFEFSFKEELDDENLIVSNVKYRLTNDYISNLIKENKAKCICLIECPATRFRKIYDIFTESKQIVIPIDDINGLYTISSFIVSLCDMDNYAPNDIVDDYGEYNSFPIEKYDILAIDDGYTNKVSSLDKNTNDIESIITITRDTNIVDETMLVDIQTDPNTIIVHLPPKSYDDYDRMKNKKAYWNIYHSFIVIPTLTYAISCLQSSKQIEIETLALCYGWFSSIISQYKNIYNKELNDEDFSKISSIVLAQKLIGCPTTKAIVDSFDILSGRVTLGMEGEDDE